MKQNEAVVTYTKQVLGSSFNSSAPISSYVTEEQRREIVSLMLEGFISGEVVLAQRSAGKLDDDKALRSYASSVVANWFNKAPQINGGGKYEAKNPGSRTNPQIKQATEVLKNLIASGAEETKIVEVKNFIANVRAEMVASKPAKTPRQNKAKQLDLSSIPEHLRALVG